MKDEEGVNISDRMPVSNAMPVGEAIDVGEMTGGDGMNARV